MSTSICHISSVHPRTDVRIFVKEISSLKKNGYDVSFLVADGKQDDLKNCIFDIGKPSGRIQRLLLQNKIYRRALSLQCDVYHFHDPELISLGVKLKKKGKKVIYDIHEDLPRQLLTKPYIPSVIKKTLSHIVEKYENRKASHFDAIVTATDHIKARFQNLHQNVKAIKNFPLLEEFVNTRLPLDKDKGFSLLYIGSLTQVRGIRELLKAIDGLPITLHVAGSFPEEAFKEEIINDPIWNKIKYHGFVDRKIIQHLLSSCHAGLVLLHPTMNYLESLPVKMFEYMAAGLPVIASDFPLWKTIINMNSCGICVDPLNVEEIKKAIEYLAAHPSIAEEMGNRGKKAVQREYHWGNEEKKLLTIYNNVLS